jgi:beta-aspartyl-peptidase (threonine type)
MEKKKRKRKIYPVLVIHGGAGTILQRNMTPEREKIYRDGMCEILENAYDILSKGGTALDAVETAVLLMENLPLFNAGKGSVFTNDGKNELDASIMSGKDLKAGAVAGVMTIKNPVVAARAVMDKSEHVLMIGEGAEKFAQQRGLEIVDPSYFFDQGRWDQLQKIISTERSQLDHTEESEIILPPFKEPKNENKFGTVGAVALDNFGDLAAATSTGGMTNKRYGRVGDSPIIGCGTYANNKTCAVSATGHGEYFMRAVVAYDVSCLMEYKRMSLIKACDEVVMKKLVAMGGEGGIIALDAKGNVAMPFNSEGMYRGFIRKDKIPTVFIYREE